MHLGPASWEGQEESPLEPYLDSRWLVSEPGRNKSVSWFKLSVWSAAAAHPQDSVSLSLSDDRGRLSLPAPCRTSADVQTLGDGAETLPPFLLAVPSTNFPSDVDMLPISSTPLTHPLPAFTAL